MGVSVLRGFFALPHSLNSHSVSVSEYPVSYTRIADDDEEPASSVRVGGGGNINLNGST